MAEKSKERMYQGTSIFATKMMGILSEICTKCFIQGPVLSDQDCDMTCVEANAWKCVKCNEGIRLDEIDLVRRADNFAREDSLKPVKIKNKVVFMPAPLVGSLPIDYEVEGYDHREVTVLVPLVPDAIDLITEEACERAFQQRHELSKLTKFLSRRFILPSKLSATLTILYRNKLAEIRKDRLDLLKSMMCSSRGPVTSRNPNFAKIMNRNPHYAATKPFSLTNQCPWSDGYARKRSNESSAISCINGRVKTKVTLRILNSVAVDSRELQRALYKSFTFHYEKTKETRGILACAPVVLQYLRIKVKLLLEHVLSQLYQDWDLQISFDKNGWNADLTGYLYSEEFDNINKKIAVGGDNLKDIMEAILKNPEIQPIVSLSSQHIADCCGLREEEAEVCTNFFFYKHLSFLV